MDPDQAPDTDGRTGDTGAGPVVTEATTAPGPMEPPGDGTTVATPLGSADKATPGAGAGAGARAATQANTPAADTAATPDTPERGDDPATDGTTATETVADGGAHGTPKVAAAKQTPTPPVTAVNALGSPVAAAPPWESPPKRREEVPWPIIWSAIGVVLGAAAAIELLLALQRVVELVVIAAFLAVVLSPAVSGLVRLKMRRGLATALVFLLGMVAFGGLGYLFIHPLYREATHLGNDLPGTLARVQAGKGRIGQIVARYHLQKDAATYIPKIRTYLSNLGGPALSAAKTVLSGLGSLVVLMVMTFLLLLEGPSAVRGILRVLPPAQGRRVRRLLDDIAKSVTGYVIGNFATSVIAGMVIGVTLLVLNVPFAVVFGVWVALVDLLPLVGGLLAGVPTVAFAFLISPTAGIVTLIVFLVYQQLENHLLNPVIMSRTVRLNPLWVLLSVLAGAELLGIVGALLAIPAAGTIHVVARDIWDERRGRLKTTPTVGPDEKTPA